MKHLRPLVSYVFVFIALLMAVIGCRSITQFGDHMVRQVALSHIRHDATGLSTLDKNRPFSSLTPEQMESAIEGRKLVDEAKKYMSWFIIAAQTTLLVFLTFLIVKVFKKTLTRTRVSAAEVDNT